MTAGGRCMHETVFADIYPDVGYGMAMDTEEYQIAGAQVSYMNGQAVLLACGSWNSYASMGVAVMGEPTAVEPGWAIASVAVGMSQHAQGRADDPNLRRGAGMPSDGRRRTAGLQHEGSCEHHGQRRAGAEI